MPSGSPFMPEYLETLKIGTVYGSLYFLVVKGVDQIGDNQSQGTG